MIPRNFAIVAVRVLAVYVLVQALIVGARAGDYLFRLRESWPSLAGIGALLAVGAYLWTRSTGVAARMTEGFEKGPDVRPAFGLDELQSAALATLGLYILVLAVPLFVDTLGQLVVNATAGLGPPALFTRYNIVNLFAVLIRAGFGLWLFVGSQEITKKIRRWRRMDLVPEEH